MPKARRDHARNAKQRTSAGVPRDSTGPHPRRGPRRQVHQCARRMRSHVSCAGALNRAASRTATDERAGQRGEAPSRRGSRRRIARPKPSRDRGAYGQMSSNAQGACQRTNGPNCAGQLDDSAHGLPARLALRLRLPRIVNCRAAHRCVPGAPTVRHGRTFFAAVQPAS
jgi:hypothetical protein